MIDSDKHEAQSSSGGLSSSVSNAPYEAPLTKAFDKLTSEIFIFLLAYVILLIGLAVFGSRLANNLRNLLYIIPVLGVIVYAWLQQKDIVKDAKAKGIDVKAGMVTRDASVFGVQGVKAGEDLPENVRVGVGFVKDRAKVGGVVYDNPEPEAPQSSYLEVMTDIFEQLDRSNQIKLISSAEGYLRKQENRSA